MGIAPRLERRSHSLALLCSDFNTAAVEESCMGGIHAAIPEDVTSLGIQISQKPAAAV